MHEIRINSKMDNVTFGLLAIGLGILAMVGPHEPLIYSAVTYLVVLILFRPNLNSYLIKKVIIGILSLNDLYVGGTYIATSDVEPILKFVLFNGFVTFMLVPTIVIILSFVFEGIEKKNENDVTDEYIEEYEEEDEYEDVFFDDEGDFDLVYWDGELTDTE